MQKSLEEYADDYAWLINAVRPQADSVEFYVSKEGEDFRIMFGWKRPPDVPLAGRPKVFVMHVENTLTRTSLNSSLAMHHSLTREQIIENVLRNRPEGWVKP